MEIHLNSFHQIVTYDKTYLMLIFSIIYSKGRIDTETLGFAAR